MNRGILLVGGVCSGKDTFAKEVPLPTIAFADLLKSFQRILRSHNANYLYQRLKEYTNATIDIEKLNKAAKEIPYTQKDRLMLQWLGNYLTSLDTAIFARAVFLKTTNQPYVISDCRRQVEFNMFKDRYYTIYLDVNKEARIKRLMKRDKVNDMSTVLKILSHQTELEAASLKEQCDMIIHTDKLSIDELKNIARHLGNGDIYCQK